MKMQKIISLLLFKETEFQSFLPSGLESVFKFPDIDGTSF